MGHLDYQSNGAGQRSRRGWDPEMAGLVSWFEAARLPSAPYELCPGLRVVDPTRFYENIHMQIIEGTDRNQGQLGLLRATLRCLYTRFR